MKTKVIPVGKRVLIKKKDADAYFQGTSIMIPESQRQDELKGYVIAVGKEVDEVKIIKSINIMRSKKKLPLLI